jgi:hypothetical protein
VWRPWSPRAPFGPVGDDRRDAVAEHLDDADGAVVAGPLGAVNASQTRGFDPLFTLEGVDAAAIARTVPESELVALLDESPLRR